MSFETTLAALVGGSALLTAVIAAWKRFPIAKVNKFYGPKVIDYAKTNFDSLANKGGLITIQSLRANEDDQWRTVDDIQIRDFLSREIGTIGHKLGTDTDALGATAITTAVADPSVTPVALAGFVVYGISRDDLDQVARIEVGPLGGVHVYKWVKHRNPK